MFFLTSENLGVQCAHCFYVQKVSFVRNKKGLVVGMDVPEENQYHSDTCNQRYGADLPKTGE